MKVFFLRHISAAFFFACVLVTLIFSLQCGLCQPLHGTVMAASPELQKMVRMYGKRAVSIVSISINAPDEKKFVLQFLQEQHAINRNLLFGGSDMADA